MPSNKNQQQVWLITGAGRGMGAEIARAALAAGYAVVATARNTGTVTAALGKNDDLLAVKLDVTDPADAEAAVRAAAGRFGRIDVLVNNAGNFYAGFFEEISPEDFRAQVETTLFGPVNVTRAVLPVMRAQRSRRLAEHGASIALVARRRDRLEALAAEIDKKGSTMLAVEADITDRAQAEAAVQQTVEKFGRLDTLVNNAGLMLLGPVADADPDEWERMIAINTHGLLYTTRAALPYLLNAAEDGPRQVADIVNISSIAGRVAWNGYGVYNMTKFGVNGFTESLRQEVTKRHVRVGVLEPGGVSTELGSHNSGTVREEIDAFYETTEVLAPEDVADAVAYMVSRPRHTSIGELWIMPTDQV
jgi:NADP-dependent 3-hydroxy acid dehydrogenase YdfG